MEYLASSMYLSPQLINDMFVFHLSQEESSACNTPPPLLFADVSLTMLYLFYEYLPNIKSVWG